MIRNKHAEAVHGGNYVGLDLVINRIGKPSGKHPMKSPDLRMDTGVRRERIDIREKRV